MEEELLEGEEIVVIAQQSLVVKDQTSASAKISGEELLSLPVKFCRNGISVQAGVNEGQSGGLHIRGGRSSEIKYYVDGIAVSIPTQMHWLFRSKTLPFGSGGHQWNL